MVLGAAARSPRLDLSTFMRPFAALQLTSRACDLATTSALGLTKRAEAAMATNR